MSKAREDDVVREFRAWAGKHCSQLPAKQLLDFKKNDYSPVEEAFDALCGYKVQNRRFGPTATSKALFAIRPEAFIPWDSAIRIKLGFGQTGADYVAFLRKVRQDLEGIEDQCRDHHIELSDLSTILNRPSVTPVQLVDEYYWVTLTRGCTVPRPAQINKWISWSSGT